jgi:hypothetical protein
MGTHKLECRPRNKSGHGKNVKRGAPTLWRDRERDTSGHGKNAGNRRALTNWGAQAEGQVRTWKE